MQCRCLDDERRWSCAMARMGGPNDVQMLPALMGVLPVPESRTSTIPQLLRKPEIAYLPAMGYRAPSEYHEFVEGIRSVPRVPAPSLSTVWTISWAMTVF